MSHRFKLGSFAISVLLICSPALAQNVKKEMRVAYQAYKDLQPYLYDSKAFEDPRNADRIYKSIKILGDNFHSLNKLKPSYSEEPGFDFNLKILDQMLDDAAFRFKEGKKAYAQWRIRTVSSNCITCHVTYKISTTFNDQDVKKMHLAPIQRAEFFLATRQFSEAEEALTAVLKNPAEERQHLPALRRLLTIYVRVKADPKAASELFNGILPTLKLTTDEKDEVKTWLISLQNWSKEPPDTEKGLALAEKLIRDAVNLPDPLFDKIDSVELLRASALLHTLLGQRDLPKEDRSKALYLIGFSYSRLTNFFVDALPELFLEQCIDEYPATYDAKRAYRLYKDIITLGFTGSGGVNIPDDVDAHLLELHDKAYGIPAVDGKV